MSPSPEELKEASIKLFRELHENKKRNEAQEEEYRRLLELHGHEIISHPELLKKKKEEKTEYAVNPVFAKDIKAIIADYKEKTGKEPEQTEQGVVLAFNKQEDAISFFKEQSSKGRAFDMYCAAKDHRVYSDGKGLFVHGTRKEVGEYLKKPEDFELGKDGKLTKKEEPTDAPSQQL
ncbi:hypothetical protein [Legionella maioricensis]|uniref:Substrate of the Dot/Icm secretion system n=1 Tax=Legionella maioricensis TaxID=2896528 RepID=A0A9X2D018_9GAMM|nr:hypothetical protein [Legionella maioricensis]MCL9683896.1 hypothetical protein [Legionella maioricensis]MCL9686743.1 hypothetical protein [Legionella maioricensis]